MFLHIFCQHCLLCLHSTSFVFCPSLHLQVDFLLRSLISLVVVLEGYCCVFQAVQDTNRKIVTCPIMYLHFNRDVDIFPMSLLVHIYMLSPIFMHTYFASSDLVLCLVFIYVYLVLHTLRPMLLIFHLNLFIFDTLLSFNIF